MTDLEAADRVHQLLQKMTKKGLSLQEQADAAAQNLVESVLFNPLASDNVTVCICLFHWSGTPGET